MKTRESGMPDQPLWDSFFDPPSVLRTLGLNQSQRNVADFGCGYGTFTIPAARVIAGVVYAFDIDAAMVAATNARAQADGLTNVHALRRDFVAEGTGLPNESVDYVMLFNILHAENPDSILREAHRILSHGGLLAIMHWNYDTGTPRGPGMAIRPKPGECRQWAIDAGFELSEPEPIALPPYHYGLVLRR